MKVFGGLFSVAMIGVYLALFAGWVMNIISLIHMADGGITTMFVLRVIGIFAAPLGGILGYF